MRSQLISRKMNPYLKNLSKIEFVVTYACTGRCKHCSEGDHTSCGEQINPQIAADAVRTEGNRLVGIISHVNELKERIDKQIVVTKEKSGGSKIDMLLN